MTGASGGVRVKEGQQREMLGGEGVWVYLRAVMTAVAVHLVGVECLCQVWGQMSVEGV